MHCSSAATTCLVTLICIEALVLQLQLLLLPVTAVLLLAALLSRHCRKNLS
jgi:hypothetical protein